MISAVDGFGEASVNYDKKLSGPDEINQLVSLAKADLSRRLKVNRAEITLEKTIPTTWPDASLGCPEPDGVYAQALTSGYILLLACGENTYEYRADSTGQTLIYVGCKHSEGLVK